MYLIDVSNGVYPRLHPIVLFELTTLIKIERNKCNISQRFQAIQSQTRIKKNN